ncbi:MAG: hypothetical protein EHM12_12825 [Dehalococcoidia bacterium]|nr:MAG: hypothetical protein EHM12_12825 [Dehalococcoidia bacterium]
MLRHFYRPALLGLSALALPPAQAQVSLKADREQFADLRWDESDLALAFENPVGLLTQALVTDFNQIVQRREERNTEERYREERGETTEAKAEKGSKKESKKGKEIPNSSATHPPDKIVLMFDTYESVHPVVGEWLLTCLLGQAREAIDCDLRIVIAGRLDLFATDERWAQQWADLILSLPLEPFTPAEVADFVKKNMTLTVAQRDKAIGTVSFSPLSTPFSPLLPVWLTLTTVSGVWPSFGAEHGRICPPFLPSRIKAGSKKPPWPAPLTSRV